MCNRTWDGWLCWDDTKAGVVSEQHCPDYFQDFDPSGIIYCAFIKKKKKEASRRLSSVFSFHVSLPTEMVTKVCTDGGYWFQHPESNRTWTNYTRCNEHTNEGRVVGHHGMIITGH